MKLVGQRVLYDTFKHAQSASINSIHIYLGSCHKRQKPQMTTPQAPIRNRQTRKVANAKGLNRNTNLA